MIQRNDRNIGERPGHSGWRGSRTALAQRAFSGKRIHVPSLVGRLHGFLWLAADLDQFEWLLAANPKAVGDRRGFVDDRKTGWSALGFAKMVQSNRANNPGAPCDPAGQAATRRGV